MKKYRWSILVLGLFCASAASAAPPALHVGSDWRPMVTEQCTAKTVDSLISRQFAGGQNRGVDAWGYNERNMMVVSCLALRNGTYIQVFSFGQDSAEAERLRNEVRIDVFNGPNLDLRQRFPDTFNSDSCALGGRLCPGAISPPAVHWGFDSRAKNMQTCVADSQQAMNRKNLQSSVSGSSIVYGTSNDITAVLTCTPTQNGVFMFIAVGSMNSQMAESYRNEIREIAFGPKP